MAHSKSAQKRIRQTERRTLVNRMRTSRVRTFIKNVETALDAGDKAAAQEAFKRAEPELARAAHRGTLPMNTAARKLSRLSRRIKALGAPSAT